ncbi:hypothetical protein ACQRBK_08640, partial [Peptoniphilaceae bacterium SGI.137]
PYGRWDLFSVFANEERDYLPCRRIVPVGDTQIVGKYDTCVPPLSRRAFMRIHIIFDDISFLQL